MSAVNKPKHGLQAVASRPAPEIRSAVDAVASEGMLPASLERTSTAQRVAAPQPPTLRVGPGGDVFTNLRIPAALVNGAPPPWGAVRALEVVMGVGWSTHCARASDSQPTPVLRRDESGAATVRAWLVPLPGSHAPPPARDGRARVGPGQCQRGPQPGRPGETIPKMTIPITDSEAHQLHVSAYYYIYT